MEKSTLFLNEPNKHLFCPVCVKVYENPVLTNCGHTFCKQCIQNLNDKCPIDGTQCSLKLTNVTIAEQIGDLHIHCMYGVKFDDESKKLVLDEHGCKSTVLYAKRSEHESICLFRIIKCPNSATCESIRFKDLEEHLKTCDNVHCPYSKYNCSFSGLKKDVEEHLKSCRYENFKEVLAFYDNKLNSYEETMQELHQTVSQKDEHIQSLTNYISTLSLRMDNFEKKVEDKFNILDDNQQALCNEINKEYKRLGDEISYLKMKFNELKPKQAELPPDREPQTTVKCLGTYVGHIAAVTCLVSYNDNLISGSLDDSIKFWDTTSKYCCIKTLEGNKGGIKIMTIMENTLYTVGEKDKKILVWNLDIYEKIRELNHANIEICSILAFDDKLVIGSVEFINIHDSTSFKLIKEFNEENEGTVVSALKIFNKILYSGSFKALKVWDLKNFTLLSKVALPGRTVFSIELYGNNLIVANDNTIYFLDAKNYQIISTLNGHRAPIIDLVVAQSNLGDKLFSASKDRTLRVWSLEFLICSQILHRHEGYVTSLASIQNRVYSGATDQQIKVWQINAFGRNI